MMTFHINSFRISVFYKYSVTSPRAIRIVQLWTMLLSLMFFSAVFYVLAYPDTGPCAAMMDEQTCLAQESPYDNREPNCVWDDASATCIFNEPEVNFETTIIIATVSIIFAAPIVSLQLWLIDGFIGRATDKTKKSKRKKKRSGLAETRHTIIRTETMQYQKERQDIAENEIEGRLSKADVIRLSIAKEGEELKLDEELEIVCDQLKFHCSYLKNCIDKSTDIRVAGKLQLSLTLFRDFWDLDESGDVRALQTCGDVVSQCSCRDRIDWIRKQLKYARMAQQQISEIVNDLPSAEEKSLVVLRYHIMEYLDQSERRVASRFMKVKEIKSPVALWMKGVAWAILVIINTAMG